MIWVHIAVYQHVFRKRTKHFFDKAELYTKKYSFTNANLEQYTKEALAYMQARRFFVELCIKESKQQSDLSVKLFGSIATAAPEYDSNYKYQTMAYYGWSINYACCKHYTAESCRLYACLVD